MGLCKCPKRKVTNLFCFEHRVNVCESCLIINHETCVVQTYLTWLTDSEYDPNCLLCSEPLGSKETVRLKCLHIFHWSCLNVRISSLPSDTDPSGFKCSSCLDTIFPSPNQSGPIVDKLTSKLQTVNWGRQGLGLPKLPELDLNTVIVNNPQNTFSSLPPPVVHFSADQHSISYSTASQPALGRRDSVSINVDGPFEANTFTSRSKLLPELRSRNDDDLSDSKYMKRAGERTLRTRIARIPRSVKRILLALLLLVLLYFLISIFLGNGNSSRTNGVNPLFDPHANPNIRIESKES